MSVQSCVVIFQIWHREGAEREQMLQNTRSQAPPRISVVPLKREQVLPF